MGLFDILAPFLPSGDPSEVASLPDRKELLRRIIAQVQNDAGVFAQQKLRLIGLQDRASTLTRIDRSQDSAVIQLGQAKQLLDHQEALEREALARIQEALGFQDNLAKDPFWQNIFKADLTHLGVATLAKAADGARRAAALIKGLNDLRSRMQGQVNQVGALEKGIADSEAYVQGRGVTAALDRAASGAAGFSKDLLKWPLIAGAAVAAVSLFGIPMPRRHAGSNPRRGRTARRRGRR